MKSQESVSQIRLKNTEKKSTLLNHTHSLENVTMVEVGKHLFGQKAETAT